MLANPGRCLTDYEIRQIFLPAYNRALNIEKAINGFKCSELIDEEDFAPARVTEQLLQEPAVSSNNSHPDQQPAGEQLGAKQKKNNKKMNVVQNKKKEIGKWSNYPYYYGRALRSSD